MSLETAKRPQIGAMFRGPGPARYLLPGSTGYRIHDPTKNKAPAYSLGIKSSKLDQGPASPGPAYLVPPNITRTGMEGTPRYSLAGRTKSGGNFQTPAPGTYSPEKQKYPYHKYPPQYSFGARTRSGKKDQTPGPNTYNLPGIIGPKAVGKKSAPSYSLVGRSKIGGFHEDLQKTPGPGTYRVSDPNTVKNKLPAYSMTGRNTMPGDNTKKPGPGAYSPERVYINKKIAPKFSFGIRWSEYTAPMIAEPID